MTAANGIIKAQQMADIGVRIGKIESDQGNINPTAPRISVMPMKRMKRICNPSTPVCPNETSFCSRKIRFAYS